MEVVIINLGDGKAENENKIPDLLNTLFSQDITPDKKEEILNQRFDIATTAELESEVDGMCNLGNAIEKKGKEIGRQEGRQEQARATAIRMNTNGLPLEMIADSIGFDIETVKKWISN